jgi:hypothetical protein
MTVVPILIRPVVELVPVKIIDVPRSVANSEVGTVRQVGVRMATAAWGRIMTAPVELAPLERWKPLIPLRVGGAADATVIVHTAMNDARVNTTPLFDVLRIDNLPASVTIVVRC